MLLGFIKSIYRRLWVLPRIDQNYKALTIKETFQTVYREKMWGDDGKLFHSGAGSKGLILEEYCACLLEFIRQHQVKSVVDLGCGEFAVGRYLLANSDVRYVGIDVVPELVEYHRSNVDDPRVDFLCADITSDPLPPADLYLIRQVLQHLSNHEIARVLANLGNGRLILISEDVPLRPKKFNADKPHGPNVRFGSSGVYVDEAPFSLPVVELWNMSLTESTLLRTVLLDNSRNTPK